jgi:tetratricopeptide (TPR) repeat protein
MKNPPVIFIALVLTFGSLHACIWDSDTLATESARFPNVAAMMAGNFARHSYEFHKWRAAGRLKLVEANTAKASDYDDLAVSQHKMGNHRAAIETMKQKDKLMPGIYETYSNLGTFYIYTGELSEALVFINRALEINANAHFGREKYQKWLVLWILETRELGQANEPTRAMNNFVNGITRGFAAFVARQEAGSRAIEGSPVLTPAQQLAAVRGVTGMMYFADFDNPILQEALGDLLLAGDIEQKASHLSAFCYLQASQKVKNTEEQNRLEKLFRTAVSTAKISEDEFKSLLKDALIKGILLNVSIREQKMAWIASGKDASAEFQKKYLSAAK